MSLTHCAFVSNTHIFQDKFSNIAPDPLKVHFPSRLELFFKQQWRHRRKLQLLLIHWTAGKRAKRMPDTTVETSRILSQRLLGLPSPICVVKFMLCSILLAQISLWQWRWMRVRCLLLTPLQRRQNRHLLRNSRKLNRYKMTSRIQCYLRCYIPRDWRRVQLSINSRLSC